MPESHGIPREVMHRFVVESDASGGHSDGTRSCNFLKQAVWPFLEYTTTRGGSTSGHVPHPCHAKNWLRASCRSYFGVL